MRIALHSFRDMHNEGLCGVPIDRLLEAGDVENIRSNVTRWRIQLILVLCVTDEHAYAGASGRGSLDGGGSAEECFDFSVFHHFTKERLLVVVVWFLEGLVGSRGLPLRPPLIRFWRIPFRKKVVGHVIMSVNESRKNVGICYGNYRGAGRDGASRCSTSNVVIINDKLSAQHSVGVDDAALQNELGRICPNLDGCLRACSHTGSDHHSQERKPEAPPAPCRRGTQKKMIASHLGLLSHPCAQPCLSKAHHRIVEFFLAIAGTFPACSRVAMLPVPIHAGAPNPKSRNGMSARSCWMNEPVG